MARWSEDLLRAGLRTIDPLPTSETELEALFARSHEASRTWQSLARATDPTGRLVLPPELHAARYLASSKPFIEDDVFYGAKLLKALLEELDRADDVVSKEAGLDPLNWPEDRQRASENNRAIWNAVIKVCQRFAPGTPIADLPAAK